MAHEIETDIEFESPSGHVWNFTARADFEPAEPDVGIMYSGPGPAELFWPNGKPLSKAAYKRIPKCLWNQIDQELADACDF